jgi:hypothetical protein
MAENTGLRVYILGAGCSFHAQHGYPLAKNFIEELRSYSSQFRDIKDCFRIKTAVDRTVELLSRCQYGTCHAATIDQLVNLIWTRRCDNQLLALNGKYKNDVTALRELAVRDAKIATAACFLDKEKAAREYHLDRYANFIRRILNETGTSTPIYQRFQTTSARVLTFNYDRLFELAFFATLADGRMSQLNPYSSEVFNCGLDGFGERGTIESSRFCFLKLHGSIGLQCTDDDWGPKVFQIADANHVESWSTPKISDEMFFPRQHSPVPPMVVFPYEKDYVVAKRPNKLPFREYVMRVWTHAAHVLQEAEQIWIIGYSFDPNDCGRLIELLRDANKCKRLVIQNIGDECDRISDLLQTEYQLGFKIQKYKSAF